MKLSDIIATYGMLAALQGDFGICISNGYQASIVTAPNGGGDWIQASIIDLTKYGVDFFPASQGEALSALSDWVEAHITD